MLIKKGTLVRIQHTRKGTFIGRAKKSFNTKTEEFYPIVLVSPALVTGVSTEWEAGEEIPCKGTLCKIKALKRRGKKDAMSIS